MEPQLPLSIPEEELVNFKKFWYSLSEADQKAMNELILAAAHNQAAIKYSGYDLPYTLFLISLLIEYHKEVRRLRRLLEEAREKRSAPFYPWRPSTPNESGCKPSVRMLVAPIEQNPSWKNCRT